MKYARINLKHTDYLVMAENWRIFPKEEIQPEVLNEIYKKYCAHKSFHSVMPIFDSEYLDQTNDVIGYYDRDQLVAFSLIKKYDNKNAECVQFAWDYHTPQLGLGIASLKNECALYRDQGYQYLYLGGADEYKKKIQGFEMLGPLK